MRAVPRLPPLMALLALAAAPGCAPRSADDDELGPARLAVPGIAAGRRCEYLDPPGSLPRFADLTSLGTRGDLDLWGHGGDPADSTILSIRYSESGDLAWVRSIESTLPPHRSAALERLIHATLPERGDEGWGVRLRVSGDGDRVEILPSVVCEPRLRRFPPRYDPGFSRAELQRVLGRRVYLLVALDERGRVSDARMQQTSGSRLVDQYLVELAISAEYVPRLHDGIGVPTIYRLPLDLPNR